MRLRWLDFQRQSDVAALVRGRRARCSRRFSKALQSRSRLPSTVAASWGSAQQELLAVQLHVWAIGLVKGREQLVEGERLVICLTLSPGKVLQKLQTLAQGVYPFPQGLEVGVGLLIQRHAAGLHQLGVAAHRGQGIFHIVNKTGQQFPPFSQEGGPWPGCAVHFLAEVVGKAVVSRIRSMTCPEGLVSWSGALVYNPEETVDDLWLEAGTVLTADLLPQTQTVNVQLEGRETEETLPISWDLRTYDGQTDGTLTLSGTFLDENQAPLISFAPLTITVHWYHPEELAVTDVIWDGKNAPSASLMLLSLPEEAEVWGEVSADGESWSRWEDFDLIQEASGAPVAVFALPDDTQRYFRVVICLGAAGLTALLLHKRKPQ